MKKKFVIVILLCIVVLFAILLYKIICEDKNKKTVEIKETIKDYGYTLDDRDNDCFKESFNDLRSILSEEFVNYEEYAIALSKLFIIDLYTLNNKINKYDVGSTEYVFPLNVENYKINVKNTLYKYINDKTVDKADLPEVINVEVESINSSFYTINEKEYESYKIELSWAYKKDMGYDKEGYIIIVRENKKLFVVEKGLLGV